MVIHIVLLLALCGVLGILKKANTLCIPAVPLRFFGTSKSFLPTPHFQMANALVPVFLSIIFKIFISKHISAVVVLRFSAASSNFSSQECSSSLGQPEGPSVI